MEALGRRSAAKRQAACPARAASSGDLENGRSYRRQYHFLLEFRDVGICAVREYLDTKQAHDVCIAPPAPAR